MAQKGQTQIKFLGSHRAKRRRKPLRHRHCKDVSGSRPRKK